MKDEANILQPMKLGAHTVPGIWRYMLPEDVLYFRVDPETRSSCFACPQVKAFGFHPSTRCCSYIPRVPNFLLGFALMDPSTEATARRFIAQGFTIPEGSQLAPAQLEASLNYLSGRAPHSVVCPLLDRESKKCGIYAFRSGVCSTFFCYHDQGPAGAAFWESLSDLVTQVESALAQWALEQMGFDLDAYFQRFEELQHDLPNCSEGKDKAGVWSETARRHLFGGFAGREEELFLGCAEHIIRHKQELFAIAGRQRLRQTPGYDSANRQRLELQFPAHLIAESLPEGEPMSIASIWYSLQLAHRNLQLERHARSSKRD